MSGVRDSFSGLIPGQKAKKKSKTQQHWDEFNKQCTLSKTQRLYGFIVCAALGAVLSFMSCMFISDISDHPEKFALTYTAGNIVALSSTMFVMGPVKQVKSMGKATRLTATIIYVCSIILSLVMALKVKNVPLVILSIIIQFCALIWYALSYIPYARQMVKRCMGGAMGV